jgi:hypothetical protein
MTHVEKLGSFVHESVTLEPDGAQMLRMKGTITLLDPIKQLQPFLDRVHQAIIGDKLGEFRVDVRELTFVNSSALRLFVDWAMKVKGPPCLYTLVFVTDRSKTWQRTAFPAIVGIAGGSVKLE